MVQKDNRPQGQPIRVATPAKLFAGFAATAAGPGAASAVVERVGFNPFDGGIGFHQQLQVLDPFLSAAGLAPGRVASVLIVQAPSQSVAYDAK